MAAWNDQIEELYYRYAPVLRNLCRKRVQGNPVYLDLIEDCVQDTFTVAYNERNKLDEVINKQAWLIKICMNRFVPRLQQQQKRQNVFAFSINDPKYETSQPSVESIDQYLEDQQLLAFRHNLIQELDEMERCVYDAYFEKNLTMASISKKYGMSENRVKYIIQKIRKKAKHLSANQ